MSDIPILQMCKEHEAFVVQESENAFLVCCIEPGCWFGPTAATQERAIVRWNEKVALLSHIDEKEVN